MNDDAPVMSPGKDRLREIRRARGMSLDGLARMTGLSVKTIWRAEAGVTTPAADTRRRLAWALGTTVDELFPPAPAPPKVAA
jgi:transcriptional regulator with XRE-family HTH domain